MNYYDFYNDFYFFIDFIIYFLIFVYLIREVFIQRYGNKFSIKILYVLLGFIFSFYLVLWEISTGIYLFKFAPVLLAMFFLYLYIKLKIMLKERSEYLVAYFAFVFLMAFSIFVFAREHIMPGYEFLLLSVAAISFVFIIYLIPQVQGKARW